MSAGNRRLKSLANRLVELSKTDGIIDSEKVASVLTTLKQKQKQHLRKTLELYRNAVRDDILQSTAKVSYAGALDDSTKTQLQQSLEAKTQRKLVMEYVEDPELIAGLKVQIGDSVFERSVQGMLSQLSGLKL